MPALGELMALHPTLRLAVVMAALARRLNLD